MLHPALRDDTGRTVIYIAHGQVGDMVLCPPSANREIIRFMLILQEKPPSVIHQRGASSSSDQRLYYYLSDKPLVMH